MGKCIQIQVRWRFDRETRAIRKCNTRMRKRSLRNSGLEVAPLAFGGSVFGWTADERTSFKLLDAFVAAGFNLIDTADVYSKFARSNRGGESETIIGKWLRQRNRILEPLGQVAKRVHAKPAQVALAWLMARPTVTTPIASATSLAQLKELIGATNLKIDEASMELLNRASDWRKL
jgi:aryl-alcohol dehydrogenase-like predicted oxidoreductase